MGKPVFALAKLQQLPARIIFDTGSSNSWLAPGNARRLGVKPAYSLANLNLQSGQSWLSAPFSLVLGSQTLVVQLPVSGFTNPASDDIWFTDGLIGWQDIRGNHLLFFDSSTHTIGTLDQLPADISQWVKLKIHPNPTLAVDVPLMDGQTGTLAIDTGSDPVSLPITQYKEWRATHPTALTLTISGQLMIGEGEEITEWAWADEIQLGPIHLSDVPINAARVQEANFVDDKFAGRLGFYAFERMDLIVDNSEGYVYIRSKRPPGPPYPGFNRSTDDAYLAARRPGFWDWKVTDDVRVSTDYMLVNAAELKAKAQDYQGALADIAQALILNPQNHQANFALGLTKLRQGDWAGAEINFTYAINVDGSWLNKERVASAYYGRASARIARTDFAGALADYEQEIQFQPMDSVNARLHRNLLLRRLGRQEDDLAQLLAMGNDEWTKTKAAFVLGHLSEADFLAVAGRSDRAPSQQCDAFYFAGMSRLLRGDMAGASELFQKCLSTNMKNRNEYQLALIELQRIRSLTPN